ncbi:helix-turn-helix transcriptional regulator [Actinospica robiniae]|uniref:helix-turn-helix transcriptional regulator n=1 Tax=Actinospica robiniae TaxID=304901 RepID=UPI000550527E|nr:helix-turn-helix transcriptional regulator [Actinospica robiniae]
MSGNLLGDYLRARRKVVQPEDVGLSPGERRRRVSGLRREEVALLAGISPDYYLRLEQGRDTNPSGQVLDGLARVLRLDAAAVAHLHALAGPSPRRPSRPSKPEPDQVSAGIRELIATWWSSTPVIILNRYADVLESNALARALTPTNQPGSNVIRAAFLDPDLRKLYLNWDEMSSRAVASLRALVGTELDDVRVVELVNELSTASREFQDLWARYDVSPGGSGVSHFDHPVVGRMSLEFERLAVAGTSGQLIVVYHAAPGSPSARKLTELGNDSAVHSGQR